MSTVFSVFSGLISRIWILSNQTLPIVADHAAGRLKSCCRRTQIMMPANSTILPANSIMMPANSNLAVGGLYDTETAGWLWQMP
jgi:hypothetical protein